MTQRDLKNIDTAKVARAGVTLKLCVWTCRSAVSKPLSTDADIVASRRCASFDGRFSEDDFSARLTAELTYSGRPIGGGTANVLNALSESPL